MKNLTLKMKINKSQNGKIAIPTLENLKNLSTILVTCSREDDLKFDMI